MKIFIKASAFWMLYAGIERFESYGNVLYVLYLITYGADLYEDRDVIYWFLNKVLVN